MSHDRHRTGIPTGILENFSVPEVSEKRNDTSEPVDSKWCRWSEAHALCFTKGPAPSPSCALPRSIGESFLHTPLFDSAPKSKKDRENPDLFIGAGGRNLTDMELPPEDFESEINDTRWYRKSLYLQDILCKYTVVHIRCRIPSETRRLP